MDYSTMPLMKQLAIIQADQGAVGTLKQMAEMWAQAAATLEKSNGDFQRATNQLEPNWTDDSGVNFVTNARESGKTIDGWAKSIRDSQAQAKIEQVAGELPGTAKAVQQVVDQYKALLPFAALLGMTPEQLEMMFRPMAGAAMNKLAGTYQEATDAVSKARGGNWQGLSGDHPGAGSVSDEDGRAIDVPMAQQGVFAQSGGGSGPSSWSSAQVQGAGSVSADASDPSLSGGLGSAPVAPPATPPVTPPPVAPTAPPLPVGGMPMAPGASAFGGRGGVGGGGGPRVPGVRLGGPTGAQPVNSPAAPAPAAAPTVAQLTSATPATGVSAGGVPPMVPPLAGGLGAGMAATAGGGIGPGLARRKHRDGDDDPPTPGLPAMLSGKAGLPGEFRYVPANRAEDGDAPGTVQLIDEDLWHGETPPADRRSYV